MKSKLFSLFIVLALLLSMVPGAFAQDAVPDRPLPAAIDELKLDAPVSADGSTLFGLETSLVGASGPTKVIVRLSAGSIAERNLKGRTASYVGRLLEHQQNGVLDRIRSLDASAKVLGSLKLVLNALLVEVDGAVLGQIAADPAVIRVAPVGNYEIDLSETVPYIGATAVHGMGYTGEGVQVAVLDSGIDYTHIAFGGSGNPDDWENNDPTIIEPGTFPTAKVVGGYDFLGSEWAGEDDDVEAPDPDPLDDGPGGGHGTHVGDIIGGALGVAPDVDLFAYKVCSSISTSCSGIALLQAMEAAVDPDGDGDPTDAVDVINMSLGSNYGQPFDDDLSTAVDNATLMGVLTVASAGNSANKPYVTGTPAATNTALSVAQTSVPSAFLPFMEVLVPPAIAGQYPAIFQPWSAPLLERIEAPLQYGDGAGGNRNGCAEFAAGSLAGKIVLIDRGVCSFSIKIENVAQGGGLAGIIGLVAPGDPFEGGFGGGDPAVPGYMISLALSNMLKGQLAVGVTVAFDPAVGAPLVGTMVGSSSRGPSNFYNFFKPEIGAPGASVSAIYGTGTDTGPFGGTSGAAPMVSGSAALLVQANPDLSPAELKARLMNTGETDIQTDVLSGQMAPVSRIGGGEVRVDKALGAPAAAWDDELGIGGLNFGFLDVDKETVNLFKTVRVRNYSDEDINYSISKFFRFADDEALGAVTIEAPQKVLVKAGKDATFTVKMTIKGELLSGNYMNSGSQGANPTTLDINEFDGYLVLGEGTAEEIHLAWHVLPRKAANTIIRPGLKFQKVAGEGLGVGKVNVVNRGVGDAQIDVYSLLAMSDDQPEGDRGQNTPMPDIRAVGIQTYPVPAGFCLDTPSFVWVFAVNTWERQNHLTPVSHIFELDVDMDGTADFWVLNRDASGPDTITDGRQLTWVFDIANESLDAWFFAEHSTNTGNTALWICGDQIGLDAEDFGKPVGLNVFTTDFYFGGPGDEVTGLVVAPLGERFLAVTSDVPGKTKTEFTTFDFGPQKFLTEELGLMFFTNGDRGTGARGGATQATEAVLVLPQ